MAEKNSLWKNIRKKAEQNRRTGAKPKKPTAEMLRQEKKIKAKKYAEGGETDPPYRPLGIPMEGYEPDSVFYETPTKYSEPKQEAKPKPVNKKEDEPKPTSKRSEVLDYYLNQYLNQNSSTPKPDRYVAERDANSTPLSPAMSTKEWQEGPRSFGPTLKDLDVVTDVMQLGNFVPHPAFQLIGKIGNWGGAAIDSYQAYDDYNEGNYGSMAVNIGSAALGAYLGGKGYRRDMSNTVPGSMADKIASFGSRSGSYRPLTALPRLRNNAVIQKGLNYNRGMLGGLGAETIYDSKADGGYLYAEGGSEDEPKLLNRDGLLIAPTLPEFEISENLTDEEKFRIEKYNERLNQQKAFQEKWYPGQEYDPSNIERRAGIYADDATAKYILNNHASRNDYKNRQTYLQSFTPWQREIIARSNYAGNFEPDIGTQFRMAANKLIGRDYLGAQKMNYDSDITREDYENASRLGIFSPLMYPINAVKGIVKGEGKSALSGEIASPWVDATDMALGNEEDVWKYNTEGDIALDPLNFAGTGIGKSIAKGVGKNVEKYGKRFLRSNYNPLSIPVKNIGTRIARISDSQYRDSEQILEALKGKSSSSYFGHHGDYGDIIYGPNHRDLNKTYFKGDKTGLKKLEYDTSKDLGLKSSEDWYGKLDAYELNSEIPNNEKLDIIDFLKSMNNYQWNEADGFNTGQYVLSEGIKDLMKDYPGENLLDLGKLTGGKKIGLETFNDEQLKIVKDNLRHLFEKYGSDKIPFEIGKTNPSTKGDLYPEYKGIQLFGSPIKPIDDIAGHMGFLERNPVTGDINYTTRDVWGFNPKAYSQRYATTRIGDEIKPFEKLQIHLMDAFGKPFILHQTNPIKFKNGGHINPYMYYAGGPMQYKRGGLLKDIGLGVADFALSTIGGVTGIQSMKDIVNEKQYSNDKFDAGANFAGSIGSTALKLIPVTAPIANAAGIVGGAANKAFGIDAANYNPNQEVSDLEKAGNIIGQAGNIASMFMGNTSGAANVADAGKFMQGVNKINQFGQSPAGQLLNQGLSFEQGGNINNNSVNLQTDSMKNRYKNYRTKYKQGGNIQDKLEANGIVKIPSYVGYHYQHPDGGQAMGPDASVERDELVQLSGGGHTGMGTPEYVYPADVNNTANTNPEEGIYMPQMTSDYKMITDKYGMPRFTKKSPAKWLEEKLNRNSPFRTDVDGPTKESNDQAMAMAKGGREVAVSVNDLKQQAAQEDAMRIAMADNVAAYGGYLSKYRNLSMPYSSGGKLPKEVLRARVESHMSPEQADAYVENYAKGGGIHIKESKKGTFTASAKKHGMGVQEFASKVLANKEKYSAAMVKKANFARNASKWKHAEGGPMDPPDKFDSYWRKSDSTSYAQRGLRNDIMKVANSGVYENIDEIESARKFGYNPSAQEMMNYYRDYGRTESGKFEKARVEGQAGALKDYQNNKYLSLTNQDVIDLAERVIDNNGSYIFEGSMASGSPKANLEKTLNKLDLNRVKSMVDFKMKNKSTGGNIYAHGGPVVSNVNQDFDLYAQNRGGMMMAQGGIMPQDNGMSKQIAAALQQGADPQELLQQLIESGMDPQQAQAMLQAIMGNIQSQAPTQAPMMAMGGRTMYAEGDDIPQYAGQLGKESWLTTAAGIGQVIPDVAAGIMSARALKKKDYEVKPFTVEGPKFNAETPAINIRGEAASNKALMADTLRNSGMTAAGLRGSLAGYFGDQAKAVGKGLTDLFTQKYNVEGQGQFQADMFNAKARTDAATATVQGKEGYMQNISNAGQGIFNKLANYYANRQKAGMQQWQAENTKSPYYKYVTVDGKTQILFMDEDGNYRDTSGNVVS